MTQAHDSARLAGLGTEAVRPDLSDLDERSTADLVRLAIDEHHAVDAALEQAAPALEAAVDAVSARMRRGGRLVYLGAGTPGRLAALDAAECPLTCGTDPAPPSRGRDVCPTRIRVVRLSETLSLSRGRHAGLPARGLGSRTP